MTTVTQATEAIYQHFVDGTSLAAANYTFDDESFTPPSDELWVRLSVRHAPGGQETLGATGNRKFERRGRIIAQIFEPVGSGRRDRDVQADELLGIFEGVSVTGTTVRFHGSSEPRELSPDGRWSGLAVDVEFRYTEAK